MSVSIETLALAKKFAKGYTEDIVSSLSEGLHYKGAVQTVDDLPQNAEVGDQYTVLETGEQYAWGIVNGQYQWIKLSADSNIIEIEYSQLVQLRNNNSLIPGEFYRITDYVTKIIGYYDLTNIGAQGYLHFGKSAEHPYDIIVLATGTNELNENAKVAPHSGDTYFANANIDAWEIKYCLDNDTSRFSWADTENGKGVVYWMKDEWGNECWYDFKNVLSLRYALKLQDATAEYTPSGGGLVYNDDENAGDLQYNRYGDTYRIFTALQAYMQSGNYVNPFNFGGKDYGDYDFAVGYNILGVIQMAQIDATYLQAFNADLYYTFDYYDADNGVHIDASLNGNLQIPCQNNVFDWCGDILAIGLLNKGDQQGIGWTVFECNSECIGDSSDLFPMYANTMGNNCNNNTFGALCYMNKLGTNCFSNVFGSYSYGCIFGNVCVSNTLAACRFTIFGNNCSENTLGTECWDNVFGDACNYNTIFGECCDNTFGQSCSGNMLLSTPGNDCTSNVFGNNCANNILGERCSFNSFGEGSSGNKLQGNTLYSTFGCGCIGVTVNEIGNNADIHGLHVDRCTRQITIPSAQLSTTGKYELHSYGTAQEAVLVHKTGYNQETAVSTTDGGTTWTPVP